MSLGYYKSSGVRKRISGQLASHLEVCHEHLKHMIFLPYSNTVINRLCNEITGDNTKCIITPLLSINIYIYNIPFPQKCIQNPN